MNCGGSRHFIPWEGQGILYLSQSRYGVRKKATEVVKKKGWHEDVRKKWQDLVAAYRRG